MTQIQWGMDPEALLSTKLDRAFSILPAHWGSGSTVSATLSLPTELVLLRAHTKDRQAMTRSATTKRSATATCPGPVRDVLWESAWGRAGAIIAWRPQPGANYSSRPTILALRQPYLAHQIYVISVGCLLSQLDKSAAARKVIHLVFNEPCSSSASSWQA